MSRNRSHRSCHARPTLFAAVLLSIASLSVFAQAPAFEVASIKPVSTTGTISVGVQLFPGGRVVLSGLPLRTLVATAFQNTRVQIPGGAGWMENERYDIQAKAPESAGITNFNHTLFDIDDARLREMLQTLLLDRFQLKVRRETRTGDVYQLTRTDKALGFRPAKIPEGRDPASMYGDIGYVGGRWVLAFMTMPQLAKFASRSLVRAPVVDLTNVSGAFDYRQTVPDQDPNYADNTDSFLRMLKDVGLEMKRSTDPVETLVIESAMRPTPN